MNRGLRIGSGGRFGTLGAFGVKGGGASDTTPPTVTISSTESNGTTVLPIPVAFTLSEVSTNFAVGDVTVGGGTIANFAGSGTAYTAELTPSAPNGTITVDVASSSFTDAAGNGNTAATQFSIVSAAFTIADEFTTNRAAGAVNGTAAEPTGGTRAAIDVEGDKLSIASSALTFAAQATPAWGEEGLYYTSKARASGKMLFVTLNFTTFDNTLFGWSTAADVALASLNHKNSLYLSTNGQLSVSTGINVTATAVLSTATAYNMLIVLRATGAFVFIKGGTFTNWTLMWMDNTLTTTPLYPAFTNYQGVFTADSLRLPAATWVPVPLAYDFFGRGDGVLGNSETSGPDGQTVTARAWAEVGTWGVATNKAACSALSGSVGIATVDVGTQNVMVELVATRSAGTSGAVLRYTDTDNYIKAVHNGTNFQVIEVVGGTPNTLINAAATYGATKRTVIALRGTLIRVFYGDTAVNQATTAVVTGNSHGFFTDDTGATFDNFIIWAKGIGGEYETALNKYINP